MNLVLFKYKNRNTPFLNGLLPYLILKQEVEIIYCGVYDPSYLGVTDYEKDWLIVANDVIL